MAEPARVGILISGRGSNMLALVDGMRAGAVPAEPAVVISNAPDAAGLTAAADRGVATAVVDSKRIKSRQTHERELIEVLRSHRADLVCLAGYMRLLTPVLLDAYPGRILNIHPSLLPAFPGLHAQRQALEHGVRISGCTVHIVDEQCDHGPIILQAAVPVHDDDTEESLASRILEEEHRIYPAAVTLFLEGQLRIAAPRVRTVRD